MSLMYCELNEIIIIKKHGCVHVYSLLLACLEQVLFSFCSLIKKYK